jgi:hypothetical protein
MPNQINVGITERFYTAIRFLLESKKLRGRQTYCNKYKIDKRNFYKQEKDTQLSTIQFFWIVPLVADFGISAKWLLTGKGAMFEKKEKANAPLSD